MEASNLVAVTTSVGSTLDALGALMRLGAELAELERTRALIQEDCNLDPAQQSSTEVPLSTPMQVDSEEWAPAEAAEVAEADGEEESPTEAEVIEADALGEAAAAVVAEATPAQDTVGVGVTLATRGAELAGGRQPLTASRGRFEVTSRDRLLLQLAKLPTRFHEEVAGAFGGGTLLEITASQLALRLLESDTPAAVLRAQGYPDHIINLVKRAMATRGKSAK
uniref:Uncharacterized protein n=1 Tax=Haptolina brevifila TaxID=156173 RepID=A0A7S2GV03_9EUKA